MAHDAVGPNRAGNGVSIGSTDSHPLSGRTGLFSVSDTCQVGANRAQAAVFQTLSSSSTVALILTGSFETRRTSGHSALVFTRSSS